VTTVAVSERPRLVFFESSASGRSRRVEGFLAQVLQRRANHDTFRIQHVDVAERADLVARFGVETVPTLAIVDANRLMGLLPSPRGCRDIEAFLTPWLH
jgi:thioredoxin-like negative regulator of GroEL